jgi:hypothetical protein
MQRWTCTVIRHTHTSWLNVILTVCCYIFLCSLSYYLVTYFFQSIPKFVLKILLKADSNSFLHKISLYAYVSHVISNFRISLLHPHLCSRNLEWRLQTTTWHTAQYCICITCMPSSYSRIHVSAKQENSHTVMMSIFLDPAFSKL